MDLGKCRLCEWPQANVARTPTKQAPPHYVINSVTNRGDTYRMQNDGRQRKTCTKGRNIHGTAVHIIARARRKELRTDGSRSTSEAPSALDGGASSSGRLHFRAPKFYRTNQTAHRVDSRRGNQAASTSRVRLRRPGNVASTRE